MQIIPLPKFFFFLGGGCEVHWYSWVGSRGGLYAIHIRILSPLIGIFTGVMHKIDYAAI